MIRDLIMLPIGVFAFLGFLWLSIKKIMEVVKTKPDDPDINAKIVLIIHYPSGFNRLILQYNVAGVIKEYAYDSSPSQGEYKIGDEITLKLCQKSGLAYNREFLKRELAALLLITGAMLFGVLFIFSNIVLEIQ